MPHSLPLKNVLKGFRARGAGCEGRGACGLPGGSVQSWRRGQEMGAMLLAPVTGGVVANGAGTPAFGDFIRTLRQTAWSTDPRTLSIPYGE